MFMKDKSNHGAAQEWLCSPLGKATETKVAETQGSRMKYPYIYSDLLNSDNNVLVSSIVKAAENDKK